MDGSLKRVGRTKVRIATVAAVGTERNTPPSVRLKSNPSEIEFPHTKVHSARFTVRVLGFAEEPSQGVLLPRTSSGGMTDPDFPLRRSLLPDIGPERNITP